MARNVTLKIPHLTVVRLLNAMVETGLRGQSVQWLDRRSFDSLASPIAAPSELYGRPDEQTYHPLYVNTDKTHNEFANFMSWRVRRSMLAERNFQNSMADVHVDEDVQYEDRDLTRFLPIRALFRSEVGKAPVTDSVYSNRWIELLYGFQVFFNRRDGVDLSNSPDALVVLNQREGTTEDDLITKRFLAIHTPHACRATYATLKDGELELSEIAYQLGHSNTAVTVTYQVPAQKRLARKLRKVCETSGRPRLARALTVGEDIGHDAIELRI